MALDHVCVSRAASERLRHQHDNSLDPGSQPDGSESRVLVMALMSNQNKQLTSAAADLGVGTDLAVQVDDQVNEQKKKLKGEQPIGGMFGQSTMDLLGLGAGYGG